MSFKLSCESQDMRTSQRIEYLTENILRQSAFVYHHANMFYRLRFNRRNLSTNLSTYTVYLTFTDDLAQFLPYLRFAIPISSIFPIDYLMDQCKFCNHINNDFKFIIDICSFDNVNTFIISR